MYNLLFDYYLTRFEVLVFFLVVCGAGVIFYLRSQRGWQSQKQALEQELIDCQKAQSQKQQALEQELIDCQKAQSQKQQALEQELVDYQKAQSQKQQALEQELIDCQKAQSQKQQALEQELDQCRTTLYQKLHNYIQSAIAHEYRGSLEYISNRSIETLEELGKEQIALREKQEDIIIKAQESIRHAINIMYVFAPLKKYKTEVLDIKQLVQSVSGELFTDYAKIKGVTLMPDLDDIKSTTLSMDLTVLTISNIIHNAIKYSDRSRAVEIVLILEEDTTRGGKIIAIYVKDMGRGIKEENKDAIFELGVRDDGVTTPGNGLGLYCAREAARLQGGDVILVSSSLNQGSVFKIILPYKVFDRGYPQQTLNTW